MWAVCHSVVNCDYDEISKRKLQQISDSLIYNYCIIGKLTSFLDISLFLS